MPDRPDVTSVPSSPRSVDADVTVHWDEIIDPGGAAGRYITSGTVLRVEDLGGDACCGMLAFNRVLPSERLNVADTVKVQGQAYVGLGTVLMSDMGRAMMTVISDTAGRHDVFCGTSTEASNRSAYGGAGVHSNWPDGRTRFAITLSKFGLSRRDIHPNLNLFKGVRIDGDGTLVFDGRPTAPGRYVELRAEMDLLVVVAAVPHVLDDRSDYSVSPVRWAARAGVPTRPDDGQWASSIERGRAYTNTLSFRQSVGQTT